MRFERFHLFERKLERDQLSCQLWLMQSSRLSNRVRCAGETIDVLQVPLILKGLIVSVGFIFEVTLFDELGGIRIIKKILLAYKILE